jgi:antitoxin VapB
MFGVRRLLADLLSRGIEKNLGSSPTDTTMRLTVDNPEAYRLARAIADVTGETLTAAVIEALRQRHTGLEGRSCRASVDEILAIADRVSVHIKKPYLEHGTLLYEENGLPK